MIDEAEIARRVEALVAHARLVRVGGTLVLLAALRILRAEGLTPDAVRALVDRALADWRARN